MAKKKILVVDDEPDVVTMLTHALESDEYEVLRAYDGISALDYAETELPDLILLDIMMPMMSGYEVCQQIRANPLTRRIPILCITSAHTEDVRKRAKEAGAQTVLVKPFKTAELIAQIQRYLPPPQSAPGTS